MIKFLNNELEDINEIIRLVSMRKSLPETIIEKDMWVSYLLDYLFNRCQYKDYFEFKGGTSLSKGYGLISRFSEDVDIVVNAAAFVDVDIKDVLKLPSKTQKQKKAEELNELAVSFYKDKLIPIMQNDISKEINKDITISISEEELAIYVDYPSTYKDTYINSSVKLEIGPLAAWTPNEERKISSFIQEEYPALCEKSEFTVLITLPKRTFWEKAIILHQEANRTEGKLPGRYSRHYYDLYKMFSTAIKEEALKDIKLLDEVREFTMTFYYRSWSEFEKAVPGTFRLYPNEIYISELETDYVQMSKMIFGNYVPEFMEVLYVMRKLENEINEM
jgi:hypothetical protein